MRSGKDRKKKRNPKDWFGRAVLLADVMMKEILTRKLFDNGPSKHTKRGIMRGRIRPRKEEGFGASYTRLAK